GHPSVPNLEYLQWMKDHLRPIKQNVTESSPDQNAENGGEKDKVGYLSLAERPVAFPSEQFQEKKSSDEARQIRSAIPTDTDISIETHQKWVEVMNVEREPHRRHEGSGAAQEFKEFKEFRSSGVQEFRSSGWVTQKIASLEAPMPPRVEITQRSSIAGS
ncbi:MAG TPA: hypothetical protein VF020_18210, partial [Chthoniobacterales bacterium]